MISVCIILQLKYTQTCLPIARQQEREHNFLQLNGILDFK